jgi:hypothetical protein
MMGAATCCAGAFASAVRGAAAFMVSDRPFGAADPLPYTALAPATAPAMQSATPMATNPNRAMTR